MPKLEHWKFPPAFGCYLEHHIRILLKSAEKAPAALLSPLGGGSSVATYAGVAQGVCTALCSLQPHRKGSTKQVSLCIPKLESLCSLWWEENTKACVVRI